MTVEWKSADLRAWKRSLGWERWDLVCDSKLGQRGETRVTLLCLKHSQQVKRRARHRVFNGSHRFKPVQLLQEAKSARHPRTLRAALPNVLVEAVQDAAKLQPAELARLRCRWFQKWTPHAVELQSQERQLKSFMPDHLQRILQPKRLVLWKEILMEASYPDMGVVEEVTQGTNLVGPVKPCGVLQRHQKFGKTNATTIIRRQEPGPSRDHPDTAPHPPHISSLYIPFKTTLSPKILKAQYTHHYAQTRTGTAPSPSRDHAGATPYPPHISSLYAPFKITLSLRLPLI